ncbi:MAG TPA: FtsW/RodA/SpoVE family cell cycle protein [Actinomycetota bacterium]|nr:FtsW/RodA/SpoVE family cell cycle protein [Actinomycetota bacterium]
MSQAALPRGRPRPAATIAFTVLALVIALGAYVLAGLGKRGHVPVTFALYGSIFAIGFAAAALTIRRYAPSADPALFPTAAVLTGIGFAMIFRLSGGLAAEQATWVAIGLTAFCATVFLVRDHRQLDAYTYTIGLLGLVLLLLPIVPGIGRTINGARLWVRIGPIGFQPSEIGKVLIVVFLASYLTQKRELLRVATGGVGPLRLPPAKHLMPVLLAWGASLAVLFIQRDLGASLLYFGIFVVMLWVATGRAAYLVIGGVLFAIGAWLGYQLFDHVQLRVDVWLNALDPQKVFDVGYGQLAQAQFGMGTGGLVGEGLGRGSPALIPFASTDFIFAAIGEELGMLGTAGVLLLYLVLVGKGLRAALASPDAFGRLLATGLATAVALQTFVIVGGVTRVIPLTGVTLPFVSYGGSSLVSNFVLLALLVRVSAGPAPVRPRRGG